MVHATRGARPARVRDVPDPPAGAGGHAVLDPQPSSAPARKSRRSAGASIQSLSRSHDSETSQNLVLRQFLPDAIPRAFAGICTPGIGGRLRKSLLCGSLRGGGPCLSLKPREEVSSCWKHGAKLFAARPCCARSWRREPAFMAQVALDPQLSPYRPGLEPIRAELKLIGSETMSGIAGVWKDSFERFHPDVPGRDRGQGLDQRRERRPRRRSQLRPPQPRSAR